MKEKTIILNEIIEIPVFYKAFYRHIESSGFAADSWKDHQCYWHGEVHGDGTFEVGYHYPDRNNKGGGIHFGERKLPHQINGKLANEDGKTVIRYQQTLSSYLIVVILVTAYIFYMCLQELLSGGWLSAIPLFIFGCIFAYAVIFGTTAYRKFPQILETILNDCRKPPKDGD